MDGVLNGPESDLDCGGDCDPCPTDARCRIARDCLSGRCADEQCQEQPYRPGMALADGYHVERAEADAPATARLGGALFVGIGYGCAYVAAVSYPSRLGALYLPVLGSWIALGHVPTTEGKVLLATDGALQTAGAILLVGGLVVAGRQIVRDQVDSFALVLVPSLRGFGVAGRF
jgi:hypothetical protein